MCLALAGGKPPERPANRWQRTRQWLGFGLLLARFLAAGLWQWIAQRWILRNPHVG
ncbi:MAG: hypothetical protein H6953_04620 [Chromatiaceae bacterium]|nr:hypothetical protein [Chromatiaceae bacterium]MCP5314437.1 hypothetical protein [Chromatiaceae bacterium]